MNNIQLTETSNNRKAFVLEQEGSRLAEMDFDIKGNTMRVYHTEVDPQFEGKGIARQLLDAMVTYARSHRYQVLALCPYVAAQFKRHPEDYADIWQPNESS